MIHGGMTHRPATDLPPNCVSLTCFDNHQDESPRDYWGEIVAETATSITIRVGDETDTITRRKGRNTLIVRALT